MDYFVMLFEIETFMDMNLWILATLLWFFLFFEMIERREMEKYCGPSEWRVGKVLRW